MPLRRRAAIVLIALAATVTLLGGMLLLVGGFGSAVATTETGTTTYLGPVDRISVDVGSGDIELVARPGYRDVRVVRESRRFLARPKQTGAVRDGELRLRSDCPDVLLGPCTMDYRIEAPPGVEFVAESTSGDVEVRGMDGAVRVETTAGDVELAALRSRRVRASSTAGDVDADLLVAPGRVEASSTAGDVEVRVPAGAYAIDTETKAGDERSEGLIDDPRATRRISVRTTAGDATVRAR